MLPRYDETASIKHIRTARCTQDMARGGARDRAAACMRASALRNMFASRYVHGIWSEVMGGAACWVAGLRGWVVE